MQHDESGSSASTMYRRWTSSAKFLGVMIVGPAIAALLIQLVPPAISGPGVSAPDGSSVTAVPSASEDDLDAKLKRLSETWDRQARGLQLVDSVIDPLQHETRGADPREIEGPAGVLLRSDAAILAFLNGGPPFCLEMGFDPDRIASDFLLLRLPEASRIFGSLHELLESESASDDAVRSISAMVEEDYPNRVLEFAREHGLDRRGRDR